MNGETGSTAGGLTSQYRTYDRQKCFIAYVQQAPWSDDLLSACAEVLGRPEFNLEPDFAQKHFDPEVPLRQKILNLIANARYGIYDLSLWRDETGKWQMPRNVFIELGMAIALNRPTLLLRHASNRDLEMPDCLKGVSEHILNFSGETTLKRALEVRLPQWLNAPPERDWWNRYCIFAGRVCEYREAHPRARRWGHKVLRCHISDGPDLDREDFRSVVEEVLERFSDVSFDYLDALRMPRGYDFLLCTFCQTVRSTPFAIYRIAPHTPAGTFVIIGMSIALEAQFVYKIPKILLTDNVLRVPSLLSGYEVVQARTDRERKHRLHSFVPVVMKKVHKSLWEPRPLPFVEVVALEPVSIDEARTKIGGAKALLRQGNFEAALALLGEAESSREVNRLSETIRRIESYLADSRAALEIGEAETAISLLTKARRSAPDAVEIAEELRTARFYKYSHEGQKAHDEARYGEAVRKLKTALRYRPTDQSVLALLHEAEDLKKDRDKRVREALDEATSSMLALDFRTARDRLQQVVDEYPANEKAREMLSTATRRLKAQQQLSKRRILEKAEKRGYVTLEDMLQEYPHAEFHVDEISEVYAILREEGISIVDENGDSVVGIISERDETEDKRPRIRVNERIAAKEVRLIGEQGEQLGIFPLREALEIARGHDLDLVEVAPHADPPVCRVLDYGKYVHERARKAKEAKKVHRPPEVKDIRLRPKTGEHDINFKINRMRGFLSEGSKVKVRVLFRGREITHPEIAHEMLNGIAADLQDIAVVESPPRMEGRSMFMILSPVAKVE